MPMYQYRCPIHGVIDRRQEPVGDSFLRCPKEDGEGVCGYRLIVIRAQSNKSEATA
jgi:hypothetical protein